MIRKLRRSDIKYQEGDEDGYWIALVAGIKWAGDPLGAIHTIHEQTKAIAMREDVMPCDCPDCFVDAAGT